MTRRSNCARVGPSAWREEPARLVRTYSRYRRLCVRWSFFVAYSSQHLSVLSFVWAVLSLQYAPTSPDTATHHANRNTTDCMHTGVVKTYRCRPAVISSIGALWLCCNRSRNFQPNQFAVVMSGNVVCYGCSLYVVVVRITSGRCAQKHVVPDTRHPYNLLYCCVLLTGAAKYLLLLPYTVTTTTTHLHRRLSRRSTPIIQD